MGHDEEKNECLGFNSSGNYLVKFRLKEPKKLSIEQLDEDIVEQLWFVNLSNSLHFNGTFGFGKQQPIEINFPPSVWNSGKEFLISSRDEKTEWELLALVEEKFRKSFVPSEENKDIQAALTAFLSSKKIVKWKF